MIFQVVENDELSDTIVFKATFNDALLEITEESEDLYNK